MDLKILAELSWVVVDKRFREQTLTINLIYERLAPLVQVELKRLNPRTPRGHRKRKLFQRLTEDNWSPQTARAPGVCHNAHAFV
jgi:hypothetical protein